jgi:N-acetylglucosaminyl-diphospho-decaprenol L-rhamnosyltransferase
MTPERLTAVIANWKTPDYTIQSARALIDDGVPPQRIVIVDNGSEDGSTDRFRVELPGCNVVPLDTNVGYARAANRGAAALPGDAYLIVNNDAFVKGRGSVQRMLAALADSRIGVVVPRLLNSDGTLQPTVKPLDTPAVSLLRASGLSRFVPNRWRPNWSTHWDHASSSEIRAADGAVVLVRGTVWEELGGFSTRSYMYAEDTELCWHTNELGWRIWFEAGAEFVHLGNAATTWSNPERAERWSRSEGELLRARLSPPAAFLSILFTASGLAARVGIFRLVGQRERAANLGAQLRGYLSALRPSH